VYKWESTLPASFRQNRHEGMGHIGMVPFRFSKTLRRRYQLQVFKAELIEMSSYWGCGGQGTTVLVQPHYCDLPGYRQKMIETLSLHTSCITLNLGSQHVLGLNQP